jgi:hypothetical protein
MLRIPAISGERGVKPASVIQFKRPLPRVNIQIKNAA